MKRTTGIHTVPGNRADSPAPKPYVWHAGETPRDRLEAVIRAQLTRVTANTLTAGVVSTGILNRATEEILASAEAYAGHVAGDIVVERRQVIEAAVPETGHHTGEAR